MYAKLPKFRTRQFESGAIDPLSLTALGFLLISLLVGTRTVIDKSKSFDIQEQAAECSYGQKQCCYVNSQIGTKSCVYQYGEWFWGTCNSCGSGYSCTGGTCTTPPPTATPRPATPVPTPIPTAVPATAVPTPVPVCSSGQKQCCYVNSQIGTQGCVYQYGSWFWGTCNSCGGTGYSCTAGTCATPTPTRPPITPSPRPATPSPTPRPTSTPVPVCSSGQKQCCYVNSQIGTQGCVYQYGSWFWDTCNLCSTGSSCSAGTCATPTPTRPPITPSPTPLPATPRPTTTPTSGSCSSGAKQCCYINSQPGIQNCIYQYGSWFWDTCNLCSTGSSCSAGKCTTPAPTAAPAPGSCTHGTRQCCSNSNGVSGTQSCYYGTWSICSGCSLGNFCDDQTSTCQALPTTISQQTGKTNVNIYDCYLDPTRNGCSSLMIAYASPTLGSLDANSLQNLSNCTNFPQSQSCIDWQKQQTKEGAIASAAVFGSLAAPSAPALISGLNTASLYAYTSVSAALTTAPSWVGRALNIAGNVGVFADSASYAYYKYQCDRGDQNACIIATDIGIGNMAAFTSYAWLNIPRSTDSFPSFTTNSPIGAGMDMDQTLAEQLYGRYVGGGNYGTTYVDKTTGTLTKIFRPADQYMIIENANQVTFYREFAGEHPYITFRGEVPGGFQQEFFDNSQSLKSFLKSGGELTADEVTQAVRDLAQIQSITGQAHGDLAYNPDALHYKNILIQTLPDGSHKVIPIDFAGSDSSNLASLEYIMQELQAFQAGLQNLSDPLYLLNHQTPFTDTPVGVGRFIDTIIP